MAAPTYSPHPLLKEPVLYVADPPQHVRWNHLIKMFNRCGTVTYSGLCPVSDPQLGMERECYPVHFVNLFQAEMALATLQGEPVPGVDPPWSMALSHSPMLHPASPNGVRSPLHVVKDNSPANVIDDASAQMAFIWFRSVGPLVSTRISVKMGNSQLATVIEYWDSVHAEIARAKINDIHEDLQALPIFGLRYNPCSLLCSGTLNIQQKSVDDLVLVRKELMTKFAQFGKITQIHFTKARRPCPIETITFQSPHSASRALEVMDGELIGIFRLTLEYQEEDSSSPSMDSTAQTSPHGTSPSSYKQQTMLKEPIIYVVNPPASTTWMHLQAIFTDEVYGKVQDVGRSAARAGARKWAVRFIDLYHAEMALATMHETVITNSVPQWTMILSHSPTLATPRPSDSILSQYLQTNSDFFTSKTTPQVLFKYFRKAGPLVSVRMNVDIGNKKRAAVVKYWNEKDANTARIKKNTLHSMLRSRPAFSLRTFDPHRLRYSGFGSLFSLGDVVDAFSEFGAVTGATLEYKDDILYGSIAFSSSTDAALALQAMDGKPFRGSALTVQYEEPEAQHVFRRCTRLTSSPPDKSGDTTNETTDVPPPSPSLDRLRRETHARELKEAAERRAQEATTRAASQAKVKRQQETLRRKEEAERRSAKAKQDTETAMAKQHAACQDFDAAKQAQEMADQALAEIQKACAEAKRIWLEAVDREVEAAKKARDAQEAANEALGRKQDADASVKIAQEEEVSSRIDAEKLTAELDQDVVDEETLRQAKLAESIRRLTELRQLEQREKEEEARKEQREVEETLRRQREEAERLLSEQREREEQARRDAEARQRRYEQAVITEQVRCRTADLQFYQTSTGIQWNDQRALERFKFFSYDFDTTKFQDSQPLTFDNVPWPILARPRDMTFDVIDWGAVEKFFNAVEKLMQDKAEFRALVEKAHRRFHPDRWKSRNILSSVWDRDLRDQLEAAGIVVAQVITPLWAKTRQS